MSEHHIPLPTKKFWHDWGPTVISVGTFLLTTAGTLIAVVHAYDKIDARVDTTFAIANAAKSDVLNLQHDDIKGLLVGLGEIKGSVGILKEDVGKIRADVTWLTTLRAEELKKGER